MNGLMLLNNIITNIDISLNYGELHFQTGDEFSVTYENMDEKEYDIKQEGNCLSIYSKRRGAIRFFGKVSDVTPVIRITSPAEHIFENIVLATGACEISAATLTTNHFSLKTGAGEFHANELNVSEHASIKSGAGELSIATGNIHNLEISSGAGEVDIHATLTGSSTITAGVGEINLQLLGNPDDYSATVAKGIGNLSVNGFNSGNGMTYGTGPNHLNVTGGVGEIRISFSEI